MYIQNSLEGRHPLTKIVGGDHPPCPPAAATGVDRGKLTRVRTRLSVISLQSILHQLTFLLYAGSDWCGTHGIPEHECPLERAGGCSSSGMSNAQHSGQQVAFNLENQLLEFSSRRASCSSLSTVQYIAMVLHGWFGEGST